MKPIRLVSSSAAIFLFVYIKQPNFGADNQIFDSSAVIHAIGPFPDQKRDY